MVRFLKTFPLRCRSPTGVTKECPADSNREQFCKALFILNNMRYTD